MICEYCSKRFKCINVPLQLKAILDGVCRDYHCEKEGEK